MSQDSDTSYDDVPYPSFPYAQSHVDRLATIATMFGLSPPAIARCRVLELGCAGGGNIVPMACEFPESTFVGVDLSQVQIDEGRALIDALGLGNVELLREDVRDIGPDFGIFDYVIAHGIYSWVPEDARDKILAICKANLAPDGIAYVSYNTYPGWHMAEMLRNMMCYHTAEIRQPEKKVEQARAFVRFVHDATGDGDNAYGRLLTESLDVIGRSSDAYLYHEYLEAENNPVYFNEFAGKVQNSGLQYLGDALLSTMLIENFSSEVARKLREIRDLVRSEQYMDFLCNRQFRGSLLCHAEHRIDRRVAPAVAAKFCFTTNINDPVLHDDAVIAKRFSFRAAYGGGDVYVSAPVTKLALRRLSRHRPEALDFDTLLARARADMADMDAVSGESRGAEADRKVLASDLIRLSFAGLVDPHGRAPELVAAASDRPTVSRLVRMQAARNADRDGKAWVTNQWHRAVWLVPFVRHLVGHLDGTNAVADVKRLMAEAGAAGAVPGASDDADAIHTAVDQALANLAGQALLIA